MIAPGDVLAPFTVHKEIGTPISSIPHDKTR